MTSRSKVTGILVIAAGVLIIVLIYMYGSFVTKNKPRYFNPRKEAAAQALFDSITSRDLVNNYPETPDEVMELNLDIIHMLYGNMIADESIYTELIEIQRCLFGTELLEQNSLETQVSTVTDAVKMLSEQRISHSTFEQLPTIYNALDSDLCYIRVEQTFNNNEKYFWEYQLALLENENRWKIIRWESTDENYNVNTDGE
jgi:hypothetical protein